MKLSKKESKNIIGGANITGTFINSLIKGFTTFMDIGRYFGSSIRRLIGKNYCSLK